MEMSKEKWEVRRLGEVCKTTAGGTPLKSRKEYYEDGAIPWLLSGEVNKKEIHEATNYITDEGLNNSSAKLFPVNTVLIAMYGATAGQVGVLNFEATTNQAVCGVYPSTKLLPNFIYYYFLNIKEKLVAQAVGNAQPNISQTKIRNTEIPVPSLSEQQRIVSLLDEAFEALDEAQANTEKNLENAKELFESYLEDVFENKGEDWEEKKFQDVCVLQRGFDLPTRLREEGGYPLVSSNGITDYVDQYKVDEPGVVTGRSGTIGKVHYIEDRFWPLNTALYIREFHGNDRRFIYYFLKYFKLERFSSGAGVPTLNRNNVHSEKVFVPTNILEQKRIVKKMDLLKEEIKNIESYYQAKIENLEELRKGILEKAFNQKL